VANIIPENIKKQTDMAKDKVAIIIGRASDIGRAAAILFAHERAKAMIANANTARDIAGVG